MNHSLARILSIFLFLLPLAAQAWTYTANFEGGTVGQQCSVANGDVGCFSNTTTSSERANSGTKSARVEFLAGTDAWGISGAGKDFPSAVTSGGEIWARAYFYFATPWSWNCSPVFKVFRIHIANADGSNAGYLSAIAESSAHFVASNEVSPHQPTLSATYDTNAWQYIDLYAKLSATPGQGIFRIWKNGVLVFEDTTRATLASSTGKADFSYIFTYWNGGVPQHQYAWVDDIVYTNERPSYRDAAGNYLIGPVSGGTSYTVTPSAGSNGSISPSTPQTVNSGSTTAFTVSPNSGYTASVGGTCGGSLSGTTYTTAAITANCTVSATFSSSADTTPPSISSPLPSGVQPYGTSNVTLQVTTNEAATCKYHTSDVAYASMGSTFGSTGGTTHQQTGFATSSGTSYTRYVRCIDGSGNASASSAIIAFSMASDTTPPTLSGLSPSGLFQSSTSSVSLAVTTSESATCRYGRNSSAWAAKTAFSTTGGTSHSSTYPVHPGLADRVCFSCRDAASNESTESCTTFSVAPKPKHGYFN